MKHSKGLILGSLLGAAFLLTGCESSKEEIVAQPINIVAHNLSSTACSFIAIDTIRKKAGVTKLLYHEDDNSVSCDDYNGKTGICIEKENLIAKGSTGYGDRACIFATDEIPDAQSAEDKNKQAADPADVTAKEYLLIVSHTNKYSCNAYSITGLADKYNYSHNLKFYIDESGAATCGSYGKDQDHCEERDLKEKVEKDVLVGKWSCVIGTDQAPGK